VIYDAPTPNVPLDQGDLIDNCPILHIRSFDVDQPRALAIDFDFRRVIVLTQTCDLANEKVSAVNLAEVHDAQALVDRAILKTADVKGPLRSGRIWGMYFLPADPALGLGEMIVDLRRLHTVRLDLLRTLCGAGKRRSLVRPLYREHLAKHFADTFSRIGLPRPYETL
jgi:hypothetical protein